MNRSPKAFLSGAILVAGLVTVPVMAQTEGQVQPPVAVPPPAATIQPTQAQLQKFVQAAEKVSEVAEEYQPKVSASPDDDTRQKIIQEADEKMARLVMADGLTVDEFIAINQAVEQDPQLRQRVIDLANKPGS